MWTQSEGNTNMTSFLPSNYELPATPSGYTKFEEGQTVKFRILKSWMENDCVLFWEYFDERWEKGKPVRSLKAFESTPWISTDRKPKEVWAFKVWNYNLNQVQICSVWQKTIKVAIMWFINDEDYWDPLNYDIKIKREWKGLETEYTINPAPPKEFNKELLETWDKEIDWFKYLEWESPFTD